MLTKNEAKWISKRRLRWNILVALRNGTISIIEAEKHLRALDAND
jgi:hypothetical protein